MDCQWQRRSCFDQE